MRSTNIVGRIGFVLAFIAFAALSSRAQVSPPAIDAIFKPLVTSDSPGFAVGVVRDNNLVFDRGYGLADLQSRSPITTATNFRLASLTKQFTAMGIMLLVHDGKLRYDDPLTKVLPEFPPYGNAITIRNLLNHTSGLKDYEDIYDEQMRGTARDKIPQLKDADVLRIMEQQTSTLFPPGSKWQYSNSGYAVLAMVVERVSGQRFGDFLRQRIFRPLHMDHTVAFENGRNTVAKRAFGYRKNDGAWEFADQSPTSAVLGDGGVYTSIEDMAKWATALERNKLLSAEEMKPAYERVKAEAPDGSATGYGFGWFVDSYQGQRRLWHYGETWGFRSYIQHLPGVTVIVLANRTDVDPGKLAMQVVELER